MSLPKKILTVSMKLTSFLILILVSVNAFRHFQVPYPFYISFFTLNFVNLAILLGINAKRASTFDNDDEFCRISVLNERF